MFLQHALVVAVAMSVTAAMVIERRYINNETFICPPYTWGGCCTGLDSEEFGVGCTNATLIEADFPTGSTMGPQNEYGCLLDSSTTECALCCKEEPSTDDLGMWIWVTVCIPTGPDDPVKRW